MTSTLKRNIGPRTQCKSSVRKQIENRTQNIRRFNGELEYTQYVGEIDREKTQKLYTKIIIVLCETVYIECVQWTLLYKSLRTDRIFDTYVNAHLWTPTLTPKYIPSRNICLMAFPSPHRSGLCCTPVCAPVYAPGIRTVLAKPIGPNLSTLSLAQPIQPMLSLSLNTYFDPQLSNTKTSYLFEQKWIIVGVRC